MAGIQIVDLPESIELDREAMSTLYGGSKYGSGGSKTARAMGLQSRKKRGKNNTLLFFPEKNARSPGT